MATALFDAVVAAARAAGRWLMVIWTSDRPEYQAARNFYLRMGCDLMVQLADFYDRDEALCVFTLRLEAGPDQNHH